MTIGDFKMDISNTGVILQTQSFSLHDGDGIRTVIFLTGCPLRCKWCSNPETWTVEPKLVFSESKPSPTMLCKETSVQDILKKIKRDEVFYRHSNGGVTFSGGEPTFKHKFLRSLAQNIDALGVDMWIETCGYFYWEDVKDIFSYFSHVFFDIKSMDTVLHKEFTGIDNTLILQNAINVYKTGVKMVIRIPCVKEVNFNERNLTQIAEFIKTNLPRASLELLPYHDFGKEKYNALKMSEKFHKFTPPERKELEDAESLFKSFGINIVKFK